MSKNETYTALRENKLLTSRTVRELDAFAKAVGVEIALEDEIIVEDDQDILKSFKKLSMREEYSN